VKGLGGKLGLITAKRGVCPADKLLNPVAKACPTTPSLSPMIKSI